MARWWPRPVRPRPSCARPDPAHAASKPHLPAGRVVEYGHPLRLHMDLAHQARQQPAYEEGVTAKWRGAFQNLQPIADALSLSRGHLLLRRHNAPTIHGMICAVVM